MRTIHVLSLALTLSPAVVAQEVVYEIAHGRPIPFGETLTRMADIDGDGVSEIAIRARLEPGGEVWIVSGATGVTLRRIVSEPQTFDFARSLADAGDTDGDGVHDLLVGSGDWVRVFSGATGERLLSLGPDSPAIDIGFGQAVVGMGDLNGDGHDDFALGCTQKEVWWSTDVYHSFVSGPGYVRLHSGIDGSLIAKFVGPVFGDAFGGSLAALGDVDGDGIGDLAAGSRILRPAFDPTRLLVFSGATGAVLHDFSTSLPSVVSQGLDLCGPGDLDGDGRGDLAIADNQLGTVTLVSGATGTTLWVTQPIQGGTAFGFDRHGARLRPAGDVDGDGVVDLVAGAPQPPIPSAVGGTQSFGPGYLRVLSGVDGAPLRIAIGSVEDGQFGLAVDGVGDLNGDGRSEVVVGAPFDGLGDGPNGIGPGRVRVLDLNLAPPVPRNYCAGGLNSVNRRARVQALGSASVAANDLVIQVQDAVAGKLALFIASDAASIRPFGAGYLCVETPLVRVGGVTQLDAAGRARKHVDLNLPGLGGVVAGATWHFQVVYRDQGPFGPVSNASDALRLMFVP